MLHSDAAQTNAERKEAATQLDSLLKERDALQARVKELEQISHFQESEYRALKSRALRAEQERDSLKVDCSAYASRNTNLLNDLVLAGLARDAAEQERDEAYERLKPLSEVVLPWGNVGSGMVSADAVLAARDLVRRLAAGPEKEKK
jgi:hypothetical protein